MSPESVFVPSLLPDWNQFNCALLLEATRGGEVFTSSAVAVARNVALTCAHSVENIDSGKVYWDEEYRPGSKRFVRFKKVLIHPGYDKTRSNYADDLALIVLERNLPKSVKAARLEGGDAPAGACFHRIGFGGREGRNVKTWTNPLVVGYEALARSYIMRDRFGFVGDSGGPLFWESSAGPVLFALHSTREGEDKTYCVDLAARKEWIEENMPLRLAEF